MFPCGGLPKFAQTIGEILPYTCLIRRTRGIVLREARLGDMTPGL